MKPNPIIDQIDAFLAQHYGFTHEELDFIINYDIKYRLKKEGSESVTKCNRLKMEAADGDEE